MPAPKSTKKLPESKIQKAVIIDLESAGWYVIKLIQCNKNGLCDLLAVRNNRYVWIEVKAEGGRVAPLQAFRHEELRRNGAEVIVAYSREDIKHLMIKKQ